MTTEAPTIASIEANVAAELERQQERFRQVAEDDPLRAVVSCARDLAEARGIADAVREFHFYADGFSDDEARGWRWVRQERRNCARVNGLQHSNCAFRNAVDAGKLGGRAWAVELIAEALEAGRPAPPAAEESEES